MKLSVKRLGKSGKKPRNPEIKTHLLKTFKDAKSSGMLMTKRLLLFEAKEIAGKLK